MPTLEEGKKVGDVVLYEGEHRYSRDGVTIASGEGVLDIGAVLAKDSVTGKFVHVTDEGINGTDTAVAVLIEKIDATSADVTGATVIDSFAIVRRQSLTFEATVNDATKRQSKIDQLNSVGIKIREGI